MKLACSVHKNSTGAAISSGRPARPMGIVAANFVSALRIGEGAGAHVGIDPPGGDAVYIDAVGRELGRQGLGHADDRALGRGIIAVKGFAALAAGGTDQHDVSGWLAFARLSFHLCHRVFHEAENSIEIDGQGGAPLLVRHAVDGDVLLRPDAVVGDEYVELTKMPDGFGDQRTSGFGIIQIRSDRVADVRAAFFGECFRLSAGAAITENYFRASSSKHTHRGRANTARTARDESNFAGKRKRNGHGRLVSSFRSNVASGGRLSVPGRKTCAPTSARAEAGAPACRRSAFRSSWRVRRGPAPACGRQRTIVRSPCWRRHRSER